MPKTSNTGTNQNRGFFQDMSLHFKPTFCFVDVKQGNFFLKPFPMLGLIILLAACTPQTAIPPQPTPEGISTGPPIATQTVTNLPILTSTSLPTSTPTNVSTIAKTFRTNFPDPGGYHWVAVATGLDKPVDIQNAGDGSERLFVIEQRGDIRIIQNGKLLPTPFLDIQDRINSSGTEQGLLGQAFHPNFASNGEFFVNYIDRNGIGNTVIARFQVSKTDPNRADPASEVDLLHVDQPYANHNGGGLAFGPDGYLYIGLGDGGSEGDPNRTSQNLQTFLGKMLRIDVDHGDKYTVPPDNPFANGGGLPEIWASGLRNPWRFSFDRLTGDLFIADVGQDLWEEVDFIPAGTKGGLNFGWSYYEGMHPYHDQPPADITFTPPVIEYSHAFGCAVTGGYVYRGTAYSEWQGVYFYGDYCSGTIWGLIQTSENTWQTKELFSTGAQITSFGTDENGELYFADYRSGTVLLLRHP